MPGLQIKEMDPATEFFVTTCSHLDESEEIVASAERRRTWLAKAQAQGASIKVALLDGQPVGFIHIIPIAISPWGPLGENLSVIPCLFSLNKAKGNGVGAALMESAEKEARKQRSNGLVLEAYYHDCFFMPATFFEHYGFVIMERRDTWSLLWKVWEKEVEKPKLLHPRYAYQPVAGKVVVDLFWNSFCQTCIAEAGHVRRVAQEFRDDVVFNEYAADDREILLKYQIPRAIFINGKRYDWGYEAPEEELRRIINQAKQGE